MISSNIDREVAKLKKEFLKTEKKVLSKVDKNLMTAAALVEADAVLLSPVKSGRLRGSITKRRESKQRMAVGTVVPYAKFVHDGTRFQKPQPFLDDSLKKNQKKIAKLMSKVIEQ